MNPEKMTVENCDLCPKMGRSGSNCLFVSRKWVFNLNNEANPVDVKRCAYCDTPECPICKTRTMKVNQKACGKCGHDLTPRVSK